MKIYYSETHRRHDPPFEVIDGGQRTPYLESPARMDSILGALKQTTWAEILEPVGFGLEPLRAVHSEGYLEFLGSAWRQWLAAYPENTQAPADAAFINHMVQHAQRIRRPETLRRRGRRARRLRRTCVHQDQKRPNRMSQQNT